MASQYQTQNISQNISLSINNNTIDLQAQTDKKSSDSFIKKLLTKGGTQFDQLCVKNVRNGLQSQQQNEDIINKRLKKFYHYKQEIADDYYFRPRIDPVYEPQKQKSNSSENQILEQQKIFPLEDEIILYGTDFISIKKIKQDYKPAQCKLVDESHLRLKYDSFEDLMDILTKNARKNVFQNQAKLQAGQKRKIPRKWIEMKPYYINHEQRRIIARFLTNYERQNLKITFNKKNYLYDVARQVYFKKKKEKQQIQKRHQERYFNRRNGDDYNGQKEQNMSYLYQKRERSRDRDSNIINDGHGKFAKKLLRPSMDDISISNISISLRGEVKQNQQDIQKSVSDLSYILRDINEDDNGDDNESLTPGQLIHQLNNLQIQNVQAQGTQTNKKNNTQTEKLSLSQSNRSINLSYSLSQNMPGPQVQKSFLRKSQKGEITKKFNYKKYVQQTQIQQKRKKIQVIDLCDD